MPRREAAADRSEGTDLKAFGGGKPKKDLEEVVTDGVGDDDVHARPAGDETSGVKQGEERDDGDPPEKEKEAKPDQPKGPPSDDVRNRIFKRFSKIRRGEADEGETDDSGDEAKADNDSAGKAADAGADDGKGDEAPASAFKLEVDGKTVEKSIDEVAVLADLSADEVRENPQRAIRYAQRELATQERLDRSKKILREQRSRASSEDADDDPARNPAPNQGGKDGSKGGASDTPNDDRNTSGDVDFAQLVEDIQIGDPKDIAPKLQKALTTLAQSTARTELTAGARDQAVIADKNASAAAMRDFAKEHPEVESKRYMASAIAAGLIDEYRTDLRQAMIADGYTADEADEALAVSTPQIIASSHQKRRLRGDPNVRPIDKAFIESAYQRVSKDFGVNSGNPQNKRQDFQETRQNRKEDLRTQPKRSSMPPAMRGQQSLPPDPVSARKRAVTDMQKSRGQRTR